MCIGEYTYAQEKLDTSQMEIDWDPLVRGIERIDGYTPVYMTPELVNWFLDGDMGPVNLEGGPELMAALPWFTHRGYALVSTIKYCLHIYHLRTGEHDRAALHNFAVARLRQPETYIYGPMIASELLTEYGIVKRAHDRMMQ